MNHPSFVIVGEANDLLATATATALRNQGARTHSADPGALADLSVCLDDQGFSVDGWPVAGILFRSLPDASFSDAFAVEDKGFVDAEVRALWLAAMHLDSVLTLNRYDAAAWFEGAGWAVWRRYLQVAGIPLSPFSVGVTANGAQSLWHPFMSSTARPVPAPSTRAVLGAVLTEQTQQQASLVVCGHILTGESFPAVIETAAVLKRRGLSVVEIVTDEAQHVLRINPNPAITTPKVAHSAATLIAEVYHAHLSHW